MTDCVWSVCFSVPSFFKPRQVFSSDQPMSNNLFCTQPPSTTNFLITFWCLSVQTSLVLPLSIAWIGSRHTPSFTSLCSCFAAHFFQQTILACLQSIFFTSFVQTTHMCPATCPSNSKVCHCGHVMPKSRVLHTTAPAGPLACLHVCTSKICFLQAFRCYLLHLPLKQS